MADTYYDPSSNQYATDYADPYVPPQQAYVPGATKDNYSATPHMATLDGMTQGWGMAKSAFIQAILYDKGFLSGKYAVGQWYDKTRTALKGAADAAKGDNTPLVPFLLAGLSRKDIPKAFGGTATGSGATGGAAPYNGPVTSTSSSSSTNTQVNLSSKATARAILTQVLADELGREPEQGEVNQFLRSLNVREEKNPTVTTSNTTGSTTTTPQGHNSSTVSDSNTTTKSKPSNVDPTNMAKNFAENRNPAEWNKFQDAQYYNVIASMLGMS